MSPGPLSAVEFRDVQKVFPAANGVVTALDGVSFSVNAGEVFGIIGQSGAGKSTLIRLVNLLEKPTRGRVLLGTDDITDARGEQLRDIRRHIGMIFQHFNLLASKTIAENVAFPLRVAGNLSSTQMTGRVNELLERVGLTDQSRKYPAQLSGGQKQRVGIARSLACGPKILLCDEATSALDPETSSSVLRLLAELNRELGLTVILITHQMDVVRRVCDRVAVLDRGRVAELGTAADVFLHPRHAATRRLVLEAERVEEAEQRDNFAHVPGRLVRLTFRGESTYAPLLGSIARETGVDYSILEGRIDRIKDTPYGQLTLAFVGGDTDAALARLSAAGAQIEEIPR